MAIKELTKLNEIVVCPKCKSEINLVEYSDISCNNCGESYKWIGQTWSLIPRSMKEIDNWNTWNELQANGKVSYTEDPEHNLVVKKSSVTDSFIVFCNYHGRILDIGCGLQEWPAYFDEGKEESVEYIGVDPLIEEPSSKYTQLRAIGEHLPFKDDSFDQVMSVTASDHFLNLIEVLKESKRVCKADGEIIIWHGYKKPSAHSPKNSPKWYENLKVPEGCDDRFHFKRLEKNELYDIISSIGLQIIDDKYIQYDEYRSILFTRLKINN